MTFVIAPESFFTCGFFGGILYLVFFIVSTVQTWKAWLLLYDPHHMKMMFHFCMTLYALFETLYCGSLMLHNGYALWGYSSHLVALFCYVYAFLTVFIFGRSSMTHEYIMRAGLVIVYTNLLITIITIACLFASGSYSNFQDKFSYINLLLILVHSISLMLLACGMLWYGIRLQQKLGRTSIKASPGRNRKIDILLRINAVLLVCNVCFFLRILALGLLCSDIILGNNITDRKIYLLGWFLISNWIPTLFPASTLLYIMRVKEQLVQRGSVWTERDTDRVTGNGRDTSDMVAGRRRQRSESSNSESENTQEEINPVHQQSDPRTSSLESFYIESCTPNSQDGHFS